MSWFMQLTVHWVSFQSLSLSERKASFCMQYELHISVEVASQCAFRLAECSLALLSTAEIYVTAVGCACG